MKFIAAAAALLGTAQIAYAADLGVQYEDAPLYQAPSIVQAHVDIYGGVLDLSGADDLLWIVGGAARVNIPFSGVWNFQADIDASAAFRYGNTMSDVGGYAHFYRRDASYAFGGFAGYDRLSPPTNRAMAGFEGQAYFGNTTLLGQAAYVRLGGFESQGVMVRGGVRHFFTPDAMVEGNVVWTSMLDGLDFDALSVVGTAMYRFDGTPVALFGRLRYDEVSGDAEGEQASALAGVRFLIDGGGTLQSHYATGPAMDVIQTPTPWAFGF